MLANTRKLDFQSTQRVIETLGDACFGEALLSFLRINLPVEQVTLLVFTEATGFESIVSAGTMISPQLALRLSELYCGKYFRLDPLFDRIASFNHYDSAHIVHPNASALPSSHYRSLFWQRLGFKDKCSLIFGNGNQVFYLSLYRSENLSYFSSEECALVEELAPVINGFAHAHYRLIRSGKLVDRPEMIAGEQIGQSPSRQLLESLSARERDVLRFLLIGLSNEAIALDQMISINTVKTYRKRLYKKLGISSLNELHASFFNLYS